MSFWLLLRQKHRVHSTILFAAFWRWGVGPNCFVDKLTEKMFHSRIQPHHRNVQVIHTQNYYSGFLSFLSPQIRLAFFWFVIIYNVSSVMCMISFIVYLFLVKTCCPKICHLEVWKNALPWVFLQHFLFLNSTSSIQRIFQNS